MDMEEAETRTVDELRRELSSKESRISERLAALQGEVSALAPPLPKDLVSHPLVRVGGMLLAGLAVGLLFGGRRKTDRSSPGAASHRALVDGYVEALVSEAARHIDRGADPRAAFRAAVSDHVPVIVVDGAGEEDRRRGSLHLLRLAARYALPLVMKMGIERLLHDGGGTETTQAADPTETEA